jgi:hypothetical protein
LRFPQTVLKTQLASRENYGTGNNMAYWSASIKNATEIQKGLLYAHLLRVF